MSLLLYCNPPTEGDGKGGSLAPVQGDGALELFYQAGDQLHAQGCGIPEIDLLWKADTSITDREYEAVYIGRGHGHGNGAVSFFWKGML